MKKLILIFIIALIILPIVFSEESTIPDLIPYRKGDKWGYSDKDKNILIQCKYADVKRFSEGLAAVSIGGGSEYLTPRGLRKIVKWSYINVEGRNVTPYKYDFAEPVTDGLAYVRVHHLESKSVLRNYENGYIDIDGNEVIPLKCWTLGKFSEGLIYYFYKDMGFINKKGEKVIVFKGHYNSVKEFKEGLAPVNGQRKINNELVVFGREKTIIRRCGEIYFDDEGSWGFINKHGEEVIPCKFENVSHFSEGLAAVNIGKDYSGYYGFPIRNVTGKWGFINMKGEIVIPVKYDFARSFSEGLAVVRIADKWGFINMKGEIVISIKYEEVKSFANGLAAVKLGGKWGWINKKGEQVVLNKYDFIGDFSEGLARVIFGREIYNVRNIRSGGRCGFINKKDAIVIPIKYSSTDNFKNGIVEVYFEGKKFYIDKNGTEYFED